MARAFEFRLQPLLDWRRRVEQERRCDLDACRRDVDECDAELERIGAARTGCDAADLRLRDAYLRYLDGESDALGARRGELEAASGRAREELLAASRERGIIEKLKERRRRAFEAEEARREELELDDGNARRRERMLRERVARIAAEKASP